MKKLKDGKNSAAWMKFGYKNIDVSVSRTEGHSRCQNNVSNSRILDDERHLNSLLK